MHLKMGGVRAIMVLLGGSGIRMCRYAQSLCLLAVCGLVIGGCVSTRGDEGRAPAATVESLTIEGSFEEVWQATRRALLEQKYEVYTRDTRGLFVAYSKVKRRLFFFPHRMQLTLTLERVSANSTQLSVETIHQKYRVTLLTYPDWRDDPKPAAGDEGRALLEMIGAGFGLAGLGVGSEPSAESSVRN